MSKTKMRCISCGKWFQSANAKDTTCPDCLQKARKEKLTAKTTPPLPQAGKPANMGTAHPAAAPPPRPKPAGTGAGTSHWLDSLHDVKVGEPDQPPPRPKLPPSSAPRDNRGEPDRGGFRDRDRGSGGPGNYRDRDERGPGNTRGPAGYRGPGGYRENDYRSPGGYRESGYRVGGGMGIPGSIGQRPRQPVEGGPNRDRGPRPDKFRPVPGGKPKGQKPPKPPAPTRPKKEKTPPPPPFVPTPEQITLVENRYLELATPAEFDGIRTQISQELSIPKTAVKKIIKELRDRQDIPSWWELQTYKGSEEELAKIKEVYEPMLPVPPVGVHKQIAEQLSLKPGVIYQAIKVIRQELKLPQYNDPIVHGLQPEPAKKTRAEADTSEAEQSGKEASSVENNAEPQSAPQDATPVENNPELQSESHGEITSIETDTEFHREGDTIEVGAASTAPATPTVEQQADEAK
ncbi:MAG TPA: hypothetical protein VNG51_12490 [Ktedonobacteraceae bacterium]|nr:hypothetical protein [Ktedonobacteraceae bacterium]